MGQRQGRVGSSAGVVYGGEALRSGSVASGRSGSGTGRGTLRPTPGRPSSRWGCLERSDWEGGWISLGGSRKGTWPRPTGDEYDELGSGLAPSPYLRKKFASKERGASSAVVRHGPRRLRNPPERRAGRRRRPRPGLDGLPQARPVPDLRRDRAAGGGRKRARRRPGRRLVRRVSSGSTRSAGAPTTAPVRSSWPSSTSSTRTARRESVVTDDTWRCATGPDPLLRLSRSASPTTPGKSRAGGPNPASTTRVGTAWASRISATRPSSPSPDEGVKVTEEVRRSDRHRAPRAAPTSSTSARTWSAGRGCSVSGEAGTRRARSATPRC